MYRFECPGREEEQSVFVICESRVHVSVCRVIVKLANQPRHDFLWMKFNDTPDILFSIVVLQVAARPFIHCLVVYSRRSSQVTAHGHRKSNFHFRGAGDRFQKE
jgi:hypothetical protein